MHYLFFDTETTGLDPNKHSLLTAYFGIYDENLNFVDELDLYLKPNTQAECDNIAFTPEALQVTGINLQEHLNSPATVTYQEGKDRLLKLLNKYKIKGKRRHYRPSGHNISFDKGFLFKQFIDKDEWEKLVHYRDLDTLVVTTFLQDVGYIMPDLGLLGSLVEYFKIPMGKAHNAKEDIKMNVEVYRHFKNMMKSKKGELFSNTNNDIYSLIEF